jgi:hypothetical protein
MHKRQEEVSVKACYGFGNDPMKMYFKKKTRMNVDHIIKDIIIMYNYINFII